MTFYILDLSLRNSKCGITVHMRTKTKSFKFSGEDRWGQKNKTKSTIIFCAEINLS